uniref:Mitochondrial carrier protein n=1 Tax=Knipowitschia caucasica TaxID=637954 RepID=A0AAV2LYG1_KNICA
MAQKDTLLHLFAGGCSGTVGAIVTCPLEVLKTRLQSSGLALRPVYQVQLSGTGAGVIRPGTVTPGLFQVLRSILEKEGPRSLFRGLGPNLVGVAPSRAIYFAAYSKSKELFNGVFVPNSGLVHMSSAGSAAFVTNSLMNPIWMVKTRMQLEKNVEEERRSVWRRRGGQCVWRRRGGQCVEEERRSVCGGGEEVSVWRRRGGQCVEEERRSVCGGGEEVSVWRRRGGQCVEEERGDQAPQSLDSCFCSVINKFVEHSGGYSSLKISPI